MMVLLKRFLVILGGIFLASLPVRAEFDQGLVKDALKMTSSSYKIGNDEVSRAVQAVNFLAHELTLEPDLVKAKNRAETLLAVLTKGEGVGGIRDTKHTRPQATEAERQLIIEALRLAAGYLGKEQCLSQIPETSQGPNSHQDVVRAIVNSFDDQPLPKTYNSRLHEALLQQQKTETEQDQQKDINAQNGYGIKAGKANNSWESITQSLQKTVIPEKAALLSQVLRANLKGTNGTQGVDFSGFTENPSGYQNYLQALIVTEKYRLFETDQGDLKTTDPKLTDYANTNQSAESEAILLALVSAVHNYLINPASTVEDLIRLYRYQKNNSKIKEDVRKAAKQLIETHQIQKIITQNLLDKINQTKLKIFDVQKIALDQKAMNEHLLYYSFPLFDRKTSTITKQHKFLRYLQSSGASLQCGFFSLGFESRQEALDQILDNLEEPEIFVWADRNTAESAHIRRIMDITVGDGYKTAIEIQTFLINQQIQAKMNRLKELRDQAIFIDPSKQGKEQKEVYNKTDNELQQIIDTKFLATFTQTAEKNAKAFAVEREDYLNLYAQKNNLNRNSSDFITRFQEEYNDLLKSIKLNNQKIDNEFEEARKREKFPPKVDEKDNETASQVSLLRQPYELRMKTEDARLTSFFYSPQEFKKVVQQSLNAKFSRGELEFDPNRDWSIDVVTYPQLLAILNNHNIYAWVTTSLFQNLQRQRGASGATSIHATEDGLYQLINYLEGGKKAKNISLINKSGGHFEKWLDSNDYFHLARSLRHKQKYHLGNTRPR